MERYEVYLFTPLFWFIYIAGYLTSLWICVYLDARDSKDEKDEAAPLFLFVSILWPLLPLVWAGWWLGTRFMRSAQEQGRAKKK